MLAVLFDGVFDLWKRWLSCQRVTKVPMVANFVATMLYMPFAYHFMFSLDMGILGLAYASVLKSTILLLSMVVYSKCSAQIRDSLQPISRESFRGWISYLKLSLPATVMLCAEWWAFEAMVIMAGALGVS